VKGLEKEEEIEIRIIVSTGSEVLYQRTGHKPYF
jgi:hypothetical protein